MAVAYGDVRMLPDGEMARYLDREDAIDDEDVEDEKLQQTPLTLGNS